MKGFFVLHQSAFSPMILESQKLTAYTWFSEHIPLEAWRILFDHVWKAKGTHCFICREGPNSKHRILLLISRRTKDVVESAETDHFILAHPLSLIPSISRSSLVISLRQKINWDLLSKRATYGNDHYAFIQVLAHVWTLLSCFIYYGTLFSGYVE